HRRGADRALHPDLRREHPRAAVAAAARGGGRPAGGVLDRGQLCRPSVRAASDAAPARSVHPAASRRGGDPFLYAQQVSRDAGDLRDPQAGAGGGGVMDAGSLALAWIVGVAGPTLSALSAATVARTADAQGLDAFVTATGRCPDRVE